MDMTEHERNWKLAPWAAYGLAGAGALALIVGLATFAAPRPAAALPAYAQKTHLACGRCHVNPAGGGPRTAFGKAFAANGHKLPSKGGKAGKTSAGGGAAAAPSAAFSPPIVLDNAQAQAWSLRRPYYSRFLSDY
jgi:hypothetical protein